MRIVVKVGSTLLASDKTASGLDETFIGHLVQQIGMLHEQNHEVILVTSGAVASGIVVKEGYPTSRAAMVGQIKLMGVYLRFFNELPQKIRIGQALYTYHDLEGESEVDTRERLLEGFKWQEITIVNANDAVMDEELQALSCLADNDSLAARLAILVSADLLIILTDVDGLMVNYGSPEEILIKCVTKNEEATLEIAKDTNSSYSKGGMISKVNAAKLAIEHGVEVAIVNGTVPHILLQRVDNSFDYNFGTTFQAKKIEEDK